MTGTIFGAFIGSSLARVFDLLLEKLHLLFNLKKIEFDLSFEQVSPEIAKHLQANYMLVRYGRDDVISSTVRSHQNTLATQLRTKELKLESEYNSESRELSIKFKMKRHVTYGIQFKLFFTGVAFADIKPILEKSSFIKEANPGGGDDSKIWVLLEAKTKVFDEHKGCNYSIAIAKSVEGIPNNFIYPK